MKQAAFHQKKRSDTATLPNKTVIDLESNLMSQGTRLPIAILLGCAFLLGLFHIVSNDIWWHLASGRWVAQNLAIPSVDPFSYTTLGDKWIYHNWLFDLPLAGVELVGGITGLILLRALLVAALGLAVYRMLSRNTSSAVAALLTIVALIAVKERFFLRPHLASFIFFTLEFSLLSALYEKEKINLKSAGFLAIPALILIWANMHAGVIFGIVLIGSFFCSSLIERKNVKAFLILLCVSVAAGLLNPNLWEVYTYPFKYLAIKQSLPFINEEHLPPPWLWQEPRLTVFWILSIVGAVLFAVKIKKAPWHLIILYTGFGYLALTSMRGIALFTIVNAFAISQLWLKELNVRIEKPALLLMPVITAAAIYLHPYEMKFEVAPHTTPESAVEFIQKSGIRGSMFNSHPFGGYLLYRFYPERRVFIDGRDVLHEKTMKLINKIGYRKALFAFRVEWIIAGYTDGVLRSLPKGIWSVVYFDSVSVILARRMSQNEELIDKYGYRHISPFNLAEIIKDAAPEELDAMESELMRAIEGSNQSETIVPYLEQVRAKRRNIK